MLGFRDVQIVFGGTRINVVAVGTRWTPLPPSRRVRVLLRASASAMSVVAATASMMAHQARLYHSRPRHAQPELRHPGRRAWDLLIMNHVPVRRRPSFSGELRLLPHPVGVTEPSWSLMSCLYEVIARLSVATLGNPNCG